MIMQIMVNLPQILIWPTRPHNMHVTMHLYQILTIKTRLWAKEVGEFSVMLYEPALLPQ